jgi:hypothetical protein
MRELHDRDRHRDHRQRDGRGDALPLLRSEDFGVVETGDGESPAWPIT